MRKKGIIILIVIALIVAVIAYFARDRYLEKALEYALQSVAGAKVEIDNFHYSLFKAEGSWSHLQIANQNNPWTNLIETGRASFDLEARALFWRRVIIREMVLENVRHGTPRKSDGSLPRKPEPPKKPGEPDFVDRVKASLQKQLGDVPIFDLSGLGKKMKIDSLINVENLATVQAYLKLKHEADSTFDYWRAQVDTQTYTAQIKVLEDKIKSLKLDKINDIKDVVAIAELIRKVDDIHKDINSLKNDVEGKHKALTQTFADIQGEVKQAQNSLQEDINRAKQLAKLKDLDVKDVGLMLFGSATMQRVEQLLDYVALGRKYLPTAQKLLASNTAKVEKPPRLKGQDIHFPFHYRYPRFLIRRANLTAATAAGDTGRAYFFNGTITGLTNEPPVYGRPTQFKLDLMRVDGNRYELAGSLDHRAAVPRDSLWLRAANFGLGKIQLSRQKYLPQAIFAQKGNLSLAGFFIGGDVNLKFDLDASPIQFHFEQEARDKVSQVVREVLSGLTQINLTAQLRNEDNDYKFRLNSNIDNVLANQVKLTLEKNLREAQQQVETFVRTEVDKRRQQVEMVVEKNRKTVYAGIDRVKQRVQAQLDEIEKRKKELEQRKKELEQQAKDKIKSIFKKP
ncbi:MAG: TIGR03545 family protein [candidate division KSB1 bacterium]|nr:TIGR03545 family protein [candidate division KSB1 bacterium]